MKGIEDCYQRRLLVKTGKQTDLARKELRQAAFFLRETEDLLRLEKRVVAALTLYNAYFHAARALLWRDGIKERSHYCLARYLEREYVEKRSIEAKYLHAFETMMSIRHTAQYTTEEIEIEEDLRELFNICEDFIKRIEGVMG